MKKFIVLLLVFLLMGTGAKAEETPVRLPVVMYHHVSPKDKLLGKYVVSCTELENDMRYLSENGYTAISVSELLAWHRGEGELPEKPVMITFDDGFESSYAYALPILRQYSMKGIISIIGAVTDEYQELNEHMLDYSHMTWDEAAEMSRGDIMEVQCHSYDMHELSPRKGCGRKWKESDSAYEKALSADLSKFRQVYLEYIGREPLSIALPFGYYEKATLDIAERAGYQLIFTCTEQVNLLTGEEEGSLLLGRYNRPSGVSSEKFFARWE